MEAPLPPSTPSTGQSEKRQSSNTNAHNVFEEFLHQDAQLEQYRTWGSVPEGILCARDIWQRFSGFLLEIYVIKQGASKGRHLSYTSALPMMNTLMNSAKARFYRTGCAESKTFFDCCSPLHSDEATWWKGLRYNVQRDGFQRDLTDPDFIDHSAAPMYTEHVKKVCAAYAKDGNSFEVSVQGPTGPKICRMQRQWSSGSMQWLAEKSATH